MMSGPIMRAMHQPTNQLGQPVGEVVADWRPPPRPAREAIDGRLCRLQPIDPDRHAEALFAANSLDLEGRMWTYLSYGPFASFEEYLDWMRRTCVGDDPLFF